MLKFFKENKKIIAVISDKKIGNIDFRFGKEKEVTLNRKKLANKLEVKPERLWEIEQIHGTGIKIIKRKIENKISGKTDVLLTNQHGIFLMVKIADCFPLLFFDSENRVVGAVHVGWRGAAEKIFLETLLAMINHFHSRPEKIKIIIGPGIRRCCFLHHHYIQEKLPEWKPYFKTIQEKKTLDLARFIIDNLVKNGIKKENITDCKICTACHEGYFSHFRSLTQNEPEGRMAAVIGIKD